MFRFDWLSLLTLALWSMALGVRVRSMVYEVDRRGWRRSKLSIAMTIVWVASLGVVVWIAWDRATVPEMRTYDWKALNGARE